VLEYGQRLLHQQRNIAVTSEQTSVGEFLWQKAVRDGRVSTQQDCSEDHLVLDQNAPAFAGVNDTTLFDRLLFCGNRSLIKDVYVGGKQVVADSRHPDRESVATNYSKVLNELLA